MSRVSGLVKTGFDSRNGRSPSPPGATGLRIGALRRVVPRTRILRNRGNAIAESEIGAKGDRPGRGPRSKGRRKRFFCLDMFPYPSADGFSVNQLRGIAITDVVARYQEARGKEVLRPMGWDSFGLSIEQEAQARGVSPQRVVDEGIRVMRRQLDQFGARSRLGPGAEHL